MSWPKNHTTKRPHYMLVRDLCPTMINEERRTARRPQVLTDERG
jgi:hypothetical protein